MRVNRFELVAVAGLIGFSWLGVVFAQETAVAKRYEQYGFVDLTRPLPPPKPRNLETEELPFGCKRVGAGTIADGVPLDKDAPMQDLTVSVRKVVRELRDAPGEMEAEVELRNDGTLDLQIPWSVNADALAAKQDKWGQWWSYGRFAVSVIRGRGVAVEVKDLSGALYGSKEVQGSELKVPPGGYVIARLKFSLGADFDVEELQNETWAVWASWEQNEKEWHLGMNCDLAQFFVHYEMQYEQKRPGIRLEVVDHW